MDDDFKTLKVEFAPEFVEDLKAEGLSDQEIEDYKQALIEMFQSGDALETSTDVDMEDLASADPEMFLRLASSMYEGPARPKEATGSSRKKYKGRNK